MFAAATCSACSALASTLAVACTTCSDTARHASRGTGQVRADAGVVLKLRCLFVKMRSLLEVPLLRLGQVSLSMPVLPHAHSHPAQCN